jgi:hypothetical protein
MLGIYLKEALTHDMLRRWMDIHSLVCWGCTMVILDLPQVQYDGMTS